METFILNLISIILNREERFSIDRDTETRKIYVNFPVFNGLVEYGEYYEISEEECKAFMNDETLLKAFVRECKDQKNDERLLLKPGSMRGSAD